MIPEIIAGTTLFLFIMLRESVITRKLKRKNRALAIELLSWEHALEETAVKFGLDGDAFEQEFIRERDDMLSFLSVDCNL